MHSMTGFGRASGSLTSGETLNIEFTSVNRKTLDIYLTLPRSWATLEARINKHLRSHLGRGKVNCTLRIERGQGSQHTSPLGADAPSVTAAFEELKALAAASGERIESTDGNFWLNLARTIGSPKEDSTLTDAEADALHAEIAPVLESALQAFINMRATEGEALKTDTLNRIALIEAGTTQLEAAAQEAPTLQKDKLLERLKNLDITELNLDDERLLKELAFFADRCDISEEITRLRAHLKQFREVCESTHAADGIGRKLDFLCQEIFRELNTSGSKSHRAEQTNIVLELKTELERIREQIQNVC